MREAFTPADGVHVVTKVGAVRDADGGWVPATDPDQLVAQVHDNLRTLGVDTLEVVNLRVGGGADGHSAVPGSIAERFGALAELREQGLVRHLGLSTVDLAQLDEAQAIAPVVCVQNLYNVAHREDEVVLTATRERGIAYVPYFPLGGFSPLQSQTLDDVAADLGRSRLSVALAWLLQRSSNVLLIPGDLLGRPPAPERRGGRRTAAAHGGGDARRARNDGAGTAFLRPASQRRAAPPRRPRPHRRRRAHRVREPFRRGTGVRPAWPGDLPVAAGGWQELPTPPMSPRRAPTLTWTGTELLVTGGTGPAVGPTVSCPPTADCLAPETQPLDGSGAWDPRTGTWRAVPGGNVFHHGTTWTGRLLTDGWWWLDPATGESGQAPQSDLLVYAPAFWSGAEVLCVGTDGSGQPVPHTLWAWDPSTGATRTSRVPGPDSGETCSTLWRDASCSSGSRSSRTPRPRTGSRRTTPPRTAGAPFPSPGHPLRPAGRLGRAPAARHRPGRARRAAAGPGRPHGRDVLSSGTPGGTAHPVLGTRPRGSAGRVAVGVAGRLAVLDGDVWTALPDLPEPADGDSLTAAWAGGHLVVWDDAVRRTGWSFAVV